MIHTEIRPVKDVTEQFNSVLGRTCLGQSLDREKLVTQLCDSLPRKPNVWMSLQVDPSDSGTGTIPGKTQPVYQTGPDSRCFWDAAALSCTHRTKSARALTPVPGISPHCKACREYGSVGKSRLRSALWYTLAGAHATRMERKSSQRVAAPARLARTRSEPPLKATGSCRDRTVLVKSGRSRLAEGSGCSRKSSAEMPSCPVALRLRWPMSNSSSSGSVTRVSQSKAVLLPPLAVVMPRCSLRATLYSWPDTTYPASCSAKYGLHRRLLSASEVAKSPFSNLSWGSGLTPERLEERACGNAYLEHRKSSCAFLSSCRTRTRAAGWAVRGAATKP